jgi:hypothetical protein
MGYRRPRAKVSVNVLPNAIPISAATKASLDTDTYDIQRTFEIDEKRRWDNRWTLTRFAVPRQDAGFGVGPYCGNLVGTLTDMAGRVRVVWRGTDEPA